MYVTKIPLGQTNLGVDMLANEEVETPNVTGVMR